MGRYVPVPNPPLTVEYDAAGKRRTKQFTDPIKARSFYGAKYRAGKNPKVYKTEGGNEDTNTASGI